MLGLGIARFARRSKGLPRSRPQAAAARPGRLSVAGRLAGCAPGLLSWSGLGGRGGVAGRGERVA
eukprot:7757658-Alexandrium_andersonii.AAC.1